ncbi:MAG: hypothetical protein HY735_33350 [Verrucomicrobia bacterium]|nr:hypothetical protein [Verrucomicrobiota bacterium]
MCFFFSVAIHAASNVYLIEVPDYDWHMGCFGTATGNLIGFWDRHGFPEFYSGPTGSGVAPLNAFGSNSGIHALWASEAGVDGRPSDKPGHVEDYFFSYGSTELDPHVLAGRAEHEPDCIGDFIGLSQNKWKNLNGECDGNIDAYSFVYWDSSGERRVNFTPGVEAGWPARDIQSGLRAWTQYRGYDADVFTQLSDFNPEVPAGRGFSFQALKAEIDAGYPVLLFLQDYSSKSRSFAGMDRGNPLIHGMLAYGYYESDDGKQFVRHRSSYASGDNLFGVWARGTIWHSILPLRGVIGYHPLPRIKEIVHEAGELTIRWDGPDTELYDVDTGVKTKLHWYVVEKATSLTERDFAPITQATTDHSATFSIPEGERAYFRVSLLPPLSGDEDL